jgi:hypothetical protein
MGGPLIGFGAATVIDGVSTDQKTFLKPKRHLLEQNPYNKVDFTAYTLEFGELKLGLAGIQFGLAPGLQIGTQPVLDLVGIYNGNLKYNFLRAGPVDVAFTYQHLYLPLGDFHATFMGGGALSSVRLAEKWSIHVGGQYGYLDAAGVPTAAPPLFSPYVNKAEIEGMADQLGSMGVDPKITGKGGIASLASDVRFNRRDSLVLQGTAFVWGSYEANLGSDDPMLADVLAQVAPGLPTEAQHQGIGNAYVVTLSYQMSFRRMDMRVGAGTSPEPLAWILQANDVSYRTGGETRIDDRRRKRGWRKSTDVAEAPEG